MKEQQNTPHPVSKLKNIALGGVVALGLHQSAEAQHASPVDQTDTTTVAKNAIDTAVTVPEFDIEGLYQNNQESNDKLFNMMGIFDDTTEDKTIIVEYKGVDVVTITVRSDTENTEEVFTTLEALGDTYPLYKSQADTWFEETYAQFKMKIVWRAILEEKKQTLSNNFESYVPSLDEMMIMQEEVALKNSGGRTDGYDRIYHYYKEALTTYEDTYRFYTTHDGTPESLAAYMKQKYYLPEINK